MNSWVYAGAAYHPAMRAGEGHAGRFSYSASSLRNADFYKSPQEALALIKQAITGEKEDELFYDYLLSEAPSEEEKAIITSIRDDERKHNRMFRSLYQHLTGMEAPVVEQVEFTKPKTYLEGVKKAFFGELAAVENYRNIRAGLPNRYERDMLFEILTDEQKHAAKYNYILTLNAGQRK